jgi:hypothetical protein
LYRIYQDTTVTVSEVIELIKEGLVESRNVVLPRIYHTNYHRSEVLTPPVTGLECLDGAGREKGTLWAKWAPFWNGAKVDRWDILVNNDGKVYPSNGNETTITIPGYKPGTEVVFFVRPIMDGAVGDWGHFGRCTI